MGPPPALRRGSSTPSNTSVSQRSTIADITPVYLMDLANFDCEFSAYASSVSWLIVSQTTAFALHLEKAHGEPASEDFNGKDASMQKRSSRALAAPDSFKYLNPLFIFGVLWVCLYYLDISYIFTCTYRDIV